MSPSANSAALPPAVEARVREDDATNLLAAVRCGEFDAAITALPRHPQAATQPAHHRTRHRRERRPGGNRFHGNDTQPSRAKKIAAVLDLLCLFGYTLLNRKSGGWENLSLTLVQLY